MKTNLIAAAAFVALCYSNITSVASAETTTTETPTTYIYGSPYEGEPLVEMSMGTSVGRLMAYAMNNVKVGYKSLWAQRMLNGLDDQTYYWVEGTSMTDVIGKMQGEFRMHSYHPEDEVYVWAYLGDINGNLLFYNNAPAATVKIGDNQYTIVSSKLQLRMVQRVPVKFPNAVSARIDYVDAYGNHYVEYLDVSSGYIFLDAAVVAKYSSSNGAGKSSATLIVGTYYPNGGPALSPGDSYETAYNMLDGKKIATYVVGGTPSVGVENCVVATDSSLPLGSPLAVSLIATAPMNNGWDAVNPPTADVTVLSPEGTQRQVVFTVALPFDVMRHDLVEIHAYNNAQVGADGVTVGEMVATKGSPTRPLTINKVTVGGVVTTTISASFTMEGGNTNYTIYTVIPEYEAQPRYQNGGGQG